MTALEAARAKARHRNEASRLFAKLDERDIGAVYEGSSSWSDIFGPLPIALRWALNDLLDAHYGA